MKKFFTYLIALFLSISAEAQDVKGFWTTIDDETKTPKSVVEIYDYQGKLFGRVVDIFGNKEATAKLPSSPKIIGLDIIWDLEKQGNKYKNGSILDPKKGKVYGCELWREGNNLIVRGKIAFLGRNQTWQKNTTFQKQDLTPLVPKIIKP